MTPAISSPLLRFRTLQRVKPRAATVTQHLSFPLVPATRRDCLSRLRYAFRLSQPLDVLFRSKPFRPCFVSDALMGFHLRRFPLPGSCAAVVTQRPAPLPVHRSSTGHASIFADTHPATSSEDSITPIPVQGFRHPVSPLPRLVLPRTRDPCLPWRSPPRGLIPRSRPAFFSSAAKRWPLSRRPSLMGLV